MVITNSDKPVTVGVSAVGQDAGYVFNVEVVPVSSEKLLDSNGAGDSFVGGFLAKMCLLE